MGSGRFRSSQFIQLRRPLLNYFNFTKIERLDCKSSVYVLICQMEQAKSYVCYWKPKK